MKEIKEDRSIHRAALIEMGVYNVHKQKVYGDKKKYSRKVKHKNNLLLD